MKLIEVLRKSTNHCLAIVAISFLVNPIFGRQESAESLAKEDFAAVVAGRKPVHAVLDDSKPLLSDGGTTFYKGVGYSLTVQSSISTKNGIDGFLYGPIVTFPKLKGGHEAKELNGVRFLSTEEFKKLKAH